MQTFLPYRNFRLSASCLDNKRLGKQRVEVLQLLDALVNQGGWINHPAAKMWRGYEPALCDYGIAICDEWICRGFKDTCRDKIIAYRGPLVEPLLVPYSVPSWVGNPAFHLAHQSNLVRKLPSHYRRYFPTVPDNLPYVWPLP